MIVEVTMKRGVVVWYVVFDEIIWLLCEVVWGMCICERLVCRVVCGREICGQR